MERANTAPSPLHTSGDERHRMKKSNTLSLEPTNRPRAAEDRPRTTSSSSSSSSPPPPPPTPLPPVAGDDESVVVVAVGPPFIISLKSTLPPCSCYCSVDIDIDLHLRARTATDRRWWTPEIR